MKQLVYAEAQVRQDQLQIQPYDLAEPAITLKHDQFVGHGEAVWLVQKREDSFYFIPIDAEDVVRYQLGKTFLAADGRAVRDKYRAQQGYLFTAGPGVWCRRPDEGDILWVAGHPRCRSRLDVALTLINHRRRDIKRVKKISRIVRRDREQGYGTITPRGKGSFSAIFENGKIDQRRERIAKVPWLITYSLQQGRWNLQIFATKQADYDEIADAIIRNCELHEFDLFAEMLLQPRVEEKKAG
jgi:hypothetical protein